MASSSEHPSQPSLLLSFPSKSTPGCSPLSHFPIIAFSAVANVPLSLAPFDPNDKEISFADFDVALKLPNGEQLKGVVNILRFLGRVTSGFYGGPNKCPLLSAKVDEWLEYYSTFYNGVEFEKACNYVEKYLAFRTFLVGYELSIADVAVWTSLAASGQRWDAIRKSPNQKFPNLIRWFNCLGEAYPALGSSLAAPVPSKKAGGMRSAATESEKTKDNGREKGKEEKKREGKGEDTPAELELPGAVYGKVVTRFPPEPSGFLHVGHAKAALMNEFFATKYGGKMILRFDDTNPSKEKDEYVDSILGDLKTLGIKACKITYTSDYFDELKAMAEKLILEGKAYMDDTVKERMREERMEGIESAHRSNTVEQNMRMWKEMLEGTEYGQSCCLRGKLDMTAVNKSLRDPVYFRSNPVPHHRTGTKFRAYPTYDFACPFVDSREGVTHALRSSEYHDRNEQYYRILNDMGMPRVEVWDFSRLNFQYTLLSKRKLAWFVEQGVTEGWSDPRFPTVQGLIRRGLTVEAMKQFILSQGASKNLNLMEWDKLWTINKRLIDPICPRHTAVLAKDKVPFVFNDFDPEPQPDGSRAQVRVLLRHKKFPQAGKKATHFTKRIFLDQSDASVLSEGEEVTLMDWGNAIVRRVDRKGETVVGLEGTLNLSGSVKTTKWKLTWLPDIDDLVPLTLVDFDFLIRKKKLEEDDDFTQALTPTTRWEVSALGDANCRTLNSGDIIQLERKGYFICDTPYVRPTKPMTLFAIPDGRQRAPPGEYVPKW